MFRGLKKTVSLRRFFVPTNQVLSIGLFGRRDKSMPICTKIYIISWSKDKRLPKRIDAKLKKNTFERPSFRPDFIYLTVLVASVCRRLVRIEASKVGEKLKKSILKKPIRSKQFKPAHKKPTRRCVFPHFSDLKINLYPE